MRAVQQVRVGVPIQHLHFLKDDRMQQVHKLWLGTEPCWEFHPSQVRHAAKADINIEEVHLQARLGCTFAYSLKHR